MSKIILIRPNFKRYLQPNPPLGLGYLASALKEKGHKVILIDGQAMRLNNKEIVNYIKKIKPDLIGISALSSHYDEMVKLSNLIKNDNQTKNIPLVLGGIHVSSLPEQSLIDSKADYVVIGEGELTLTELVECLEKHGDLSEIKGLIYWEDKKIKKNEERELIDNLDSIPFPAWHLMPPTKYPKDPHGHEYIRYPYAPIITTRGCPFGCTYCASTNFWKRRIRLRSTKNIVDEIEFLVKKYGVKEIHIWDDNFTLIKNHVLGFCNEISKRNINITLKCPNGIRIDSLTPKILYNLRKIGLYQMALAVESGNQKILDNVKKQSNLKKISKILKIIKKFNIIARGFFMIGLPGDTIGTIYDTINFSLNNNFDFASFFIAQPLPGSEIFCEWIKNKDLSKITFDMEYTTDHRLSDINPKILKKLFIRALQKFYFRLGFLKTVVKYPKITYIWVKNVIVQLIRRFIYRNKD